jgi:hypothetical protein
MKDSDSLKRCLYPVVINNKNETLGILEVVLTYVDIVYMNCLLNEIFDISLFYNKKKSMYVKIIFEVKA